MYSAKDIIVKVIPAKVANPFVKAHHYSGKVVNNSSLHFGVFLPDGHLHGVMSFGPSMDKRRMLSLVNTENVGEAKKWNEFLELNRMAFDDVLPRCSESRALSIAFRLIRKNAPQIKWCVSFSDATASGDGAIYRATGFLLTQIGKNKSIIEFPDGERIAQITFTNGLAEKERICKRYGIPMWTGASVSPLFAPPVNARHAPGFQLRYIKLLSPDARLNVPVLPFSEIDKAGAGMWRGKKITRAERHEKRHPEGRLDESGKVGPTATSALE